VTQSGHAIDTILVDIIGSAKQLPA
jgi:hypothetical protein